MHNRWWSEHSERNLRILNDGQTVVLEEVEHSHSEVLHGKFALFEDDFIATYYKGLISLSQVTENQFAFIKVSLKETNEKQIPQKLLFYRFSIAKVRILFLLNECFSNNVASVCSQTTEKYRLWHVLVLLC